MIVQDHWVHCTAWQHDTQGLKNASLTWHSKCISKNIWTLPYILSTECRDLSVSVVLLYTCYYNLYRSSHRTSILVMQLLFIWKTSLHLAIRVMSCENIKCPYRSPVQSWFPCWGLFSHLECQSSGCMCEAMYYCIKYSSHPCYTKLVLAAEHKFTCWKSKSTYLRFELGQCAMDRFLSLKTSSSLSRRFTPWNAIICKQQSDIKGSRK